MAEPIFPPYLTFWVEVYCPFPDTSSFPTVRTGHDTTFCFMFLVAIFTRSAERSLRGHLVMHLLFLTSPSVDKRLLVPCSVFSFPRPPPFIADTALLFVSRRLFMRYCSVCVFFRSARFPSPNIHYPRTAIREDRRLLPDRERCSSS